MMKTKLGFSFEMKKFDQSSGDNVYWDELSYYGIATV